MSYLDMTGRTEEEAITKALAQLGLDRDDVSVEILERAKSGFLGLGSAPAKVRVTYGADGEPAPESHEEVRSEPVAKPVSAAPQRKVEKRESKPAPRPVENHAPAAAPATPVASATPVELGEEVDDEKAQAIKTFLNGLLEKLESSAVPHVYEPEKGRYKVILDGDNLGALIGRRGETLDAIQQLTSYSVNRTGNRVRIQLDAENYREKREQSLQRLAQKVAGKVTKYHRSVTLEPMNAYERHVIHTALQEAPNVTTYSTGTEPNRRVIVAYDRESK